ncbi:hypothetical protein ACFV10_28665 [Streptomyces cyaneofuscatus]
MTLSDEQPVEPVQVCGAGPEQETSADLTCELEPGHAGHHGATLWHYWSD